MQYSGANAILVVVFLILGVWDISFADRFQTENMKSILFTHRDLKRKVSYEEANKFKSPESLELDVADSIIIEDQRLLLNCKLTNPTAENISIVVFPVNNNNPFYMYFLPDQGVTLIPHEGPIPQVPPPPAELIIPAMTQVEFSYVINLRHYNYNGSPTVKVEWSYNYWGSPIKGLLSVDLPEME
jgi:hypothetical protein